MVRKGERLVVRERMPYGPGHPVHHRIATGSQWFNAWLAQYCTPLTPLARKSGVPVSRLVALVRGGPITKDEVDKLAQVWGHEPEDIIASLPNPVLLIA